MREILFRGKRKDNGEWVYGLLLETPLQEYREYGSNLYIVRGYAERSKDGWDFYSYLVDEETVGQFTGLTDKNGKKIFEGDIVKVPVYFDCGCYPHTEMRTKVVKIPMFYTIAFDGDIEIIGNTTDNPELLKGGVDNG